jgi:uncharacterized integral membrane protein
MKYTLSKTAIYTSTFIVIFILVFVLQNMEIVTVELLFWDISLPRSILLSVTLLIGILLGLLFRSGRPSLFK